MPGWTQMKGAPARPRACTTGTPEAPFGIQTRNARLSAHFSCRRHQRLAQAAGAPTSYPLE
jgi:hypothetical protein